MENVDIKTIIYFLIAIVWFIFSVFRKSQKKAAQSEEPSTSTMEDNEEQTDVKTLLEEILSGKNIKERDKEIFSKEAQAPVFKVKEKKETITKPFYSDSSIKPPVSTPKVIPTKSSIQAKQERIFEIEEEYQHEILSDFDPQKAMIYSEILKRPQY